METDGTLRHVAFFEELSRANENDPAWRSVSAGLVVMRLVDQWIEAGPPVVASDSWGMNAVREAISEIPETTPLRRMLSAIVDSIASASHVDIHSLLPRLTAYGQALEYDAKFALAADVYQTVVEHADPVEDADLVVSAYIQLAFCLRNVLDLEGAAHAYEQASRVALAAGDLIGVLRGRLGDVKIAVARGNMPQAESILDETIARAQSSGLNDICSRALHERAYVAGLRGQHERAVRYAYEALELATTPRDRDRILTNIATGFRFLGLVDAARDAYLVLAATAQEIYIRWMSELNLMEIAAEQGVELQFDKYRRDLESADFTPLLRVTYLLHVGRGYHALGDSDAGLPYLERAVELAASHKLNQLLFEAEEALTAAKQRAARQRKQASTPVSPIVKVVVDAVQQMRATAGIG
jgi:tetratricopeptide (TPR) repeat protein